MVTYFFQRFGERDGVLQCADALLVAEVDEGEPLQLLDRRRVDLDASPHVELKLQSGAGIMCQEPHHNPQYISKLDM